MRLDGSALALPDWRSAGGIFAAAAEDMRPVETLTASEAALKHLRIFDPRVSAWRDFSFDRAPYLREPLDDVSSGQYRLLAMMGPSQAAKTTFQLAAMGWSVKYAPGDWMALFPKQSTASDWSQQKWQPTIVNSPDLAAMVRRKPHALSTWSQEFRNGTVIVSWPVATQIRMYTCRFFLADDFDAIPQNIDGEGDPITLLFGRTPAYEGRELGLVTSSPALGRDDGIEAIVAGGTDKRLQAPCPQCGAFFGLNAVEQLSFDRTDLPADAAASAHLRPPCGCVIDPSFKSEVVQSAVFVGAGQTVNPDSGRPSGPLKRTATASYRIDGLAAFVSWARLAELRREAELAKEQRGDETKLRGVFNTRFGVNYTTAADTEKPLTEGDLQSKVDGSVIRLGVVPAWARYLTGAIDTQGNRFEGAVIAWGDELQHALIDRFPLLEWEGRAIKPDRSAECWRVLRARMFDRVYPLASDPALGLSPACVAIDCHGLPGVTDNAKTFFRWMRDEVLGGDTWRIMLTRGASVVNAAPLHGVWFEKDDDGKRLPDGVQIFTIGVNGMKDTVDARLRFREPGPGYLHLPLGLEAAYLAELTAEEKRRGRWERKVEKAPNETLDLVVGCMAAQARLRVDRVDWTDPPAYAVPVRLAPSGPEKPAAPAARGRRMLSQGVR